tara:strand:- start:4640 stop:7690 length:3051 start_codon:yes stop_codon:yes gene_type:complete
MQSDMKKILENKFIDQKDLLKENFLPTIQTFYNKHQSDIELLAIDIISAARSYKSHNPFEKLMYEYDLSSNEGIVLMCLAEALLRIPDKTTVDQLIEDKIPTGEWKDHISKDKELFINISSMAFMLTGKIVEKNDINETQILKKILKNLSGPILRSAIKQSINILAKQFIFEKDIVSANKKIRENKKNNYAYSFDMLGEAALTYEDAESYYKNYKDAIIATSNTKIGKQHSVSIKLSALHPRYERQKLEVLNKELLPKLLNLVELGRECKVDICFDAEEADRLTTSLMLTENILESKLIDNSYNGFGLAVQAYQQRSTFVIDWFDNKLKKLNKLMNIRLVKGAYWDSEIKFAQELGLPNYPVFTKKFMTDLSYLKCAHQLRDSNNIFSQFATHNAFTISYIHSLFKDKRFEFQKLHGMGNEIYEYFTNKSDFNCRIYAPVGGYNELLPYLVRRLLENGANTSFIYQLHKKDVKIESLAESPLSKIDKIDDSNIHIPKKLFKGRDNSDGIDLSEDENIKLVSQLPKLNKLSVTSIIDGQQIKSKNYNDIVSPYDHSKILGSAFYANDKDIDLAIESIESYSYIWKNEDPAKRILIIKKLASLMEENILTLVNACIQEAGKTIQDAIADVREAIDFCRYYSLEAENLFHEKLLNGPTGESNKYYYKGKGLTFVISPWNFPIAIFTGQLVAALVTGNVVLAKPAEQTSYCSSIIFDLLFKAGLPKNAATLVLGRGEDIGPKVLAHKNLKNVLFTGSLETAKKIQHQLSAREDITNFTAETGGLNFMIADSSALTEHLIQDVVNSSFKSAGQRCSSCRVLCIEENVYEKSVNMLKGAMDTLIVESPEIISTDIGPIIDVESKNKIVNHIEKFSKIYQTKNYPSKGSFVPPTLIEINSIEEVKEEIFGPVVHVLRYKSKNLIKLCNNINNLGFGLTLGIHSRIENIANTIIDNIDVGNIYINRDMVGAVVGVQPFGGQGKSGTGPKAGGPRYLENLCYEYSLSDNIASMGGNVSLMTSISD